MLGRSLWPWRRQKALEALEPLGTLGRGLFGGDAIYVWARLPPDASDDKAVAKWLVHEHHVSIIPGSGCGEGGCEAAAAAAAHHG